MIFAGLGFAQLAAIFAAASAVAIAFYILKLRRRLVAVPFVPLWNKILRDKDATSLFSKLKRLLSLLLQLLLLLLLVLALGDPRTKQALVKGRTLVVLLDASASMQASDGQTTRFASAKDEAKNLARGLGGSDRMLVAQMDAVTTALGPMGAETSDLLRAIDAATVTDTRADIDRALAFADAALLGQDEPEIIVISDGAFGPARQAAATPEAAVARTEIDYVPRSKLSYLKVGSGEENLAITQFSVRRYPLDKARYEVMLEIANTGSKDADVELSLFGDGELNDLTKLRVRAGERLPRFYPNLTGASAKLEAKIRPLDGAVDVLPVDDLAFALLPERRRARVLVVTPGNTYLEAALLLDEYLDVTTVSPAQWVARRNAANPAEAADVVVFDGVTPLEPPGMHALYLNPAGTGAPVGIGPVIEQPGFDKIERKHPLVRFLALDDVNIKEGHKLLAQKEDRVVGASAEGPILVAGERVGKKFVVLGFDPRESDLPLRVAWPLFLVNTVNFFVDEGEDYLSSVKTGSVWRIPAPEGALSAQVTDPSGRTFTVPVHDGRAVFFGTRQGYYELAAEQAEGAQRSAEPIRFAANLLDLNESTVKPADELVIVGGAAAEAPKGFSIGTKRELWIVLVALALLLTVLEWATYHRRLTV